MTKLEAAYKEKTLLMEQLKADLHKVKEELSGTERELGTKKDGLTLLQQQLKVRQATIVKYACDVCVCVCVCVCV